jgi:hypothetical protein
MTAGSGTRPVFLVSRLFACGTAGERLSLWSTWRVSTLEVVKKMKTSNRMAALAAVVVALCALGAGVGEAVEQAPTRYAVVHETDVHGEGSVSVITYQEYVAKRREAFKLGIAFKRALMAARREWSRSEGQRTRNSGRHGSAIGGIQSHHHSGHGTGRYGHHNRNDRYSKPRRKAFPSLDVSPPAIRCVKVFAASEDAQKCADGYERMLAQKGSGLSKAQKLNPELPDAENTRQRQRDWHNRHRSHSPLRDDLRKPELTKQDMDKAMQLFEQEFQRLSEGGVRRGLARPGANDDAGVKRIGDGLGGELNLKGH